MTADMEEGIRNEVGDWIALRSMDSEMRTRIALGDTLNLSLGRVLLGTALRVGNSADAFATVTEDQVRHICDWLSAAVARGERWLSRVDEKGRPLKLMKFGTVAQILDEADKAMAKRRGDGASLKPLAGGTKIVYDAGDGWTLVRLMTPEALDIEGREMGHCVGQGAYDYGLANNFIGIYSLRDPNGKSHVTLQINHPMDKVQQIKGKQNKPPKAEYMRRLLGWRGLVDLSVEETELPAGFAVDSGRGIVELASLRRGDVFDGNISVSLAQGEDTYVLPLQPGVTVRGDVVVMGLKAARLHPRYGSSASMQYPSVSVQGDVTIAGNLKLDHVTLDAFSAKARKVIVRNSTIRSILRLDCDDAQFSNSHFEENALSRTMVGGNFDIRSCPGVVFHRSTSISSMTTVSGCRPIMGQPEEPVEFRSGFLARGLSVYNSLVSFGDIFTSDGCLEMETTSVRHMPSRLYVRWNLIVDDCIIDRWPEKMTVEGETIEMNVTVTEDVAAVERPARVPKPFVY